MQVIERVVPFEELESGIGDSAAFAMQALLDSLPGVLKACRKLPHGLAYLLARITCHPSLYLNREIRFQLEGMAAAICRTCITMLNVAV